MNWINAVNTVACLALLFYMLMAAHEATRWRHRLACIAVSVVVALQGIDPLAGWIPDMAWPSTLLTATIAVVVTLLRHDLWALLKGRMA